MNITYIISIICLLFCLFFFFYVKWYLKRRTSTSELLAEYRSEVYRLIAEIDSATDRDSQLVEDRIKKLKAILEETDKRIAVYTREFDRSRTSEALYTSLGKGIRAALKTPVETAVAQPAVHQPAPPASIPQSVVVRQNSAQQSVTPLSPPAPASAPPELFPAQQKASSKRQIRAQIETLDGEGLSPGEIASRLSISLAEVDLALNLMRSRKNH
jgi:predicted DNA-binding protein YlxM (UPF0122 family)